MKNVGYEAELRRQYFDRATSFDAFAGGPVPTSARHVRVVLFRRTTLRLAGRSVACESLHLKNTYLASAAIPRIRSKISSRLTNPISQPIPLIMFHMPSIMTPPPSLASEQMARAAARRCRHYSVDGRDDDQGEHTGRHRPDQLEQHPP